MNDRPWLARDFWHFWLTRRPWLLAAMAMCVPLQAVYGWMRAPAPGGQVYVITRPSGAKVTVISHPDTGVLTLGAAPAQPRFAGQTPGPLHLSLRDFPCTVRISLWGYDDKVELVGAGAITAEKSRYPERGAIDLHPRYPVVAPLLYAMRDFPFAWLAAALLLAYARVVGAERHRLRRERQAQNLLALGDLSEGVPLGPYRLGKLLGVGGMARVFRARREGDDDWGEVLALKVLSPSASSDGDFRERFKREVNVSRALDHPHIGHILDWGETEGHIYIAMELVEGRTLADVARERRLPVKEAVPLIRQVADALRYAHGQGVIHRDVKPANIMVTPQGKAVLMDFGIARRRDLPVLTGVGQAMGTPAYIAPEQLQGGRADWRADLYALGLMAYEMLAGKHPYEGATGMALLNCHVQADPEPLRRVCPEAPEALEELVRRMVAKDPVARAETPDDIAAALARIEAQL